MLQIQIRESSVPQSDISYRHSGSQATTEKEGKRFSHPERNELQEHIQRFLKKEDVSPSLNQKAIDIAKEVVDYLPPDTPKPDGVYPTARGEIDFDWVISKDTMLSLGVSPEGRIAYSGLFKIKGTERWSNELPSAIRHWFEGLRGYLTKTNG